MINIFLIIFINLIISGSLLALKIDKNSAIIIGNKVNVRESPSLNAKKIIQLNKGEYVVIKDSTPEEYLIDKNQMIKYEDGSEKEKGFFPWYKIEIKNKSGWVYGKFIAKSIASSNEYSESIFRKFFKIKLKFISEKEKDILWFVSSSPGEHAFDTQNQIFKIVISNDSGHYYVDDLKYNDLGDEIKEIKVLNNSEGSPYLLIDSFWHCETDPCNGQRVDILGFDSKLKKVKRIFSSTTFEHNFHGDANSIAFVDIKQNTISKKITYFKREWINEKKTYSIENDISQMKIDYIFNASKFEFEKKSKTKIPIKGIIKSETMVYNSPLDRKQINVIPINTEIIVQQIKDPIVPAEKFNKKYAYWIYITSDNFKGWIFSNTIKFEEMYLLYYFQADSSETFDRIKNVKLYRNK